MKLLHALAVSIALFVGLWVYISIGLPDLKFYPWIGFVAWAAFFAGGGGSVGFIKPLGASLAGILLTALTMYGVGMAGGSMTSLIILISILAMVLVLIADISYFSYTPAAFLGAATFFGSGGKPDDSILYVILSWVAGLTLGYLSELVGKKMAKKETAKLHLN